MKITKNRVLAVLIGMAMCATSLAGCSSESGDSAAYPSKSVKLIVPFSAGGGTDLVARAVVDAAKDSFPKGISVENKTGGSGAVGMIEGANAAKDGSTITMICVELVTVPHTTPGVTLSPDQFEPVLTLNSAYSAITVKADSPYNTLDDFIDAAAAGTIQVGNSGVGAIWHLAAAALAQEAGVEFTHIPFEGASPALTSLLGGHIDAVSVSYPEVAAQAAAGEVKVLALLAPERNAAIPDIPTAIESGYDVAVGTWRGLALPAGTDQAIVDEVYSIFNDATKTDSFVNFMDSNQLDIDVKDSATFTAQIAAEYDSYGQLISDLGLSN